MAVKDRVINIDELELEHFTQGGKFETRAVRVGPRVGAKNLGYSYDIVPPGKTGCPFHSHRAEEEMFFIVRGTGLLRYGSERARSAPAISSAARRAAPTRRTRSSTIRASRSNSSRSAR